MSVRFFPGCPANPEHNVRIWDHFCRTCGSRTRLVPDEEFAECNWCGVLISKGKHCPQCGRNYTEAITTTNRLKNLAKKIAIGGLIGGFVMTVMVGPVLHARLSNPHISGIFIWGGIVIFAISLLAVFDLYDVGY